MKNAGKACNNRLYRHIRTFEKIIKNYFVILKKCIFLSHKTHLSAGKDLAFGRVDVIVYFNFILSEVQK